MWQGSGTTAMIHCFLRSVSREPDRKCHSVPDRMPVLQVAALAAGLQSWPQLVWFKKKKPTHNKPLRMRVVGLSRMVPVEQGTGMRTAL